MQGQTTHKTAVDNSQNHTINRETLKTNDEEIIINRDILAGSDIQNSCIKHYDIEFWVISINAVENSDQSEA